MAKKILITGAGGFLGSHIADYYAEAGWQVFGAGRSNKHGQEVFKRENCEFLVTDIPNHSLSELIKNTKPDILVHCAGTFTVSRAYSSPFESFLETVGGTSFVLDAVRTNSPETHTIYLSSAAVYGNPEKLPITEETPLIPISPYGHQKQMCEQIIKRYSEDYSLSTTVLRIFSAYGERLKKQVLWDLCGKALSEKGDTLEVRGNPNDSRDYVHWRDLVSAVVCAAEKKAAGVFNVASGSEVEIKTMAELLRDELAPDKKIEFTGTNLRGYPSRWRADISKLKSLGFNPSVDITEGVKSYCTWFKEVFNKELEECSVSVSPQLEAQSGPEA